MRPEDFPGSMPDAERTRFLESSGQSAGGDDAAAACALLQLACGGILVPVKQVNWAVCDDAAAACALLQLACGGIHVPVKQVNWAVCDDAAAACALLQLACGGTAGGLSGLDLGFRV